MIKELESKDRGGVLQVIKEVDLFNAGELEYMTGLVDAYIAGSSEEGHYWIVAYTNDTLIGVAYYAPENFAQEVYNLYFLGIKPQNQGQGTGTKMIKYIESELKEAEQRILLVETSGLPEFENTRNFYLKQGFVREGVIREYYKAGDDKVIFWKKLI
jgi:ribosomal protein S18 acetylase RimI-like enzyme